ncbi:non-ribosomal peptide synthetase, partial [Bacillus cereus]|uniref:amino acid adenylation domain-containing protein n=3 Tax=Bacillus cereus group TaxID=86661 RepID=UPI000C0295DE
MTQKSDSIIDLDYEDINNSREYWEGILKDDFEKIYIRKEGEKRIVSKKEYIGSDIVANLFKITKNDDAMLYVLLLTIFKMTVAKFTGSSQFLIGLPQYLKSSEIEHNNEFIVVQNSIKDENNFKEALIKNRSEFLKLHQNQMYPVTNLIKRMELLDKVNVYFAMKNIHSKEQIEDILNQPNNDLTVIVDRTDENIIIEFNGCYESLIVETIFNLFMKVLKFSLKNLNVKIKDYEIVEETEKQKLLYNFNDTYGDYPRNKTIQDLFEEQVERNPDNIAIYFEGEHLTNKELNEKSNRLAMLLRSKGVKADTIVGIMLDRSLEMIVGIMGILKAGGAYLPIDPSYPKDRIEYMLEDSESKILLSKVNLVEDISFNGEILNISKEEVYRNNVQKIKKINKPSDLAYVIYTSGTTGEPKGVMVNHYNLINYCSSIIKKLNLKTNDETALLSSYAFDLGYTTIFTALILGIKLNIISDEKYKKPQELVQFLMNNITYIKITPSIFNIILNSGHANQLFNAGKLRMIILGGEPIRSNDLRKFLSIGSKNNIEIINHYGPTESTVGCIMKLIDLSDLNYSESIIGTPLNNIKAYIVDENIRLCDINIAGELCISGDGLARGYLNKPKLTAEKFVENPFNPGTKMYKTGDLARWLPDGNIEYLGRMDHQVKIRGFRIELGEIENRLLQHEAIREAAVVVKINKENEEYVCAYVASERDIKELNLRGFLKLNLPEYMIPNYFVQVEKMPLTA